MLPRLPEVGSAGDELIFEKKLDFYVLVQV